MKAFLITIDTEGDNLWNWRDGDKISTNNTLYLSRFQKLCESYGFKPTWLTNYEMINDTRYLNFASDVLNRKMGEIGMHLHAWSTPPQYKLNAVKNGAPYLIEYPADIMEAKIAEITETFYKNLGITPQSHRAGRWAMNSTYYDLLEKYGYKVDCSVTPHINWSPNCGQTEFSAGSDYSDSLEYPYWINNILEIPMTIRDTHHLFKPEKNSIKEFAKNVYHSFTGSTFWLRPNGKNLSEMKWLIRSIANSDIDYAMFMLHSSELMPGGSPTFKSVDSIEKLYTDLKALFSYSSELFEGCTMREYYQRFTERNI